ncbi:Na(+)-translocating NADH-quinone reductase subunit C [Pseudohongiella sp. SYSU M77423]|uniref:Na(+)-translocating NADH-quinone reductase subunit C n=1 Tax=unclassified Pseudohongiella TaxID=2629611 RepID=UPI001F008284|nr:MULTISPECIES: Na(+)-translocating NADH-quinone reductase subunit C [unclassified Pseudohongiella]MDH7945106.1 Na(+)-translocating NADH-quinone reductase subunit C [Pseudohongiella sp. SYSU M77423]MEC8858503.1 Na(+)-translocating NADH-quinone reductase subunit C [Pseudomonadota bacterium]
MSSNINSVANTIKVALGLCVVCSIVISSAAVMLKPMQTANELLDRNKNILIAAGMFDPEVHSNADVDAMFEQFTPRLVDLDEGRYLTEEEQQQLGIDPQTYDQQTARNDPSMSIALSGADDVASIRRRADYATVYVIQNETGGYESVVIPVSGYGLWGIMYGYLALESDGNTIRGIGFYDHQETPGLGGEISNPRWQAQWPGKEVYGDDGDVAFQVVKGGGSGESQVDALSGATLTSRGVENMMRFWLGENGFGPYLDNEVRG